MKKAKKDKVQKKGLTRRDFIKASAGGLAGLAVAPHLAPRQAHGAAKPIKLLCISIFSGRAAVLGQASKNGMNMAIDEFNAAGGILGRKVEVEYRDTRVKVEEAVRLAREAAASGEVDFLIGGTSSREAFAVKEAARDLKFPVLHLHSKTTALTADPNTHTKYSFRFAQNNLHDEAAGAKYAAGLAKKNGWKKWAMIGPDYAYGRENVMYFTYYLKQAFPEAEVIVEAWPKLNEPDFTPHINKIMQSGAQACFTSQWGGDIVALLEQGQLYGLTKKVKLFGIDLGDFTAINPLKKAFGGKFPDGIYMGTRANPLTPDTKANHDWFNGYVKKWGYEPTGWDQQAYTCMLFLKAAVEKVGSTDREAFVEALTDLEIVGPWGTPPSQKLKMRGRDNTLIYFTEAWGRMVSEFPHAADVMTLSWDELLKMEAGWLKEKGWLK